MSVIACVTHALSRYAHCAVCPPVCLCVCLPAGPDMSAVGMLAAINKARRTALPPTATSPGAAEWQLVEAATPLAVSALRAAAASGDTEAVVAALQQQMQPIQPTPLVTQQVGTVGVPRAQPYHGPVCSVLCSECSDSADMLVLSSGCLCVLCCCCRCAC